MLESIILRYDGIYHRRYSQLKDVSKNVFAAFCSSVLASRDKLSSLARSSTFLTFWNLARLPDDISSMPPASLRRACCRCKMTAEFEGPASSGPDFFGLSVTDIVVPKRECREDAFLAMSLRRWSSTANSRRRFWVGSLNNVSGEVRFNMMNAHLGLISCQRGRRHATK